MENYGPIWHFKNNSSAVFKYIVYIYIYNKDHEFINHEIRQNLNHLFVEVEMPGYNQYRMI